MICGLLQEGVITIKTAVDMLSPVALALSLKVTITAIYLVGFGSENLKPGKMFP
jgi:hypothetical protein